MPISSDFAVITGASQGLGAAFAEACAQRGYNLLLAALPGKELEDLAEGLRRRYSLKVETLALDLTRREDQDSLLATALAGDRSVRLLINNAGVATNGLFDLIPLEAQRRAVDLNIHSTMALTYGLIPRLAQGGRIITVASLSAYYPMPLFAVYASTKAWLLNWSLALREEVADLGIGITVVAPGGINTNEAIRAKNRSQGLSGKLSAMEPEEVAEAALKASERGKPVVIPGRFNRLIRLVGSLMPATMIARSVLVRWQRSLSKLGGGEEASWYARAASEPKPQEDPAA